MPVTIDGTTGISGPASGLTDLNASNLGSGTVPDARFPATLPAASGANLTSLNASNISSGTVPTARLATGTANSTTYLRGDQTWATVSGGVTSITAGNGLTGGTITSSGTIALDYYTGTSATNTSFPIGSYLIASLGSGQLNNAATRTIYAANSDYYSDNSGAGSAVAGTWRSRGNAGGDAVKYNLMQRTA